MKHLLVMAFIFVGIPLQALYTGSDFVEECAVPQTHSREFCNGVVYTYLKIIEDKQICYRLSESARMADLKEEILAFVRHHPLVSEAPASMLIIQSLTTYYPCHLEWPERVASKGTLHNQTPLD